MQNRKLKWKTCMH